MARLLRAATVALFVLQGLAAMPPVRAAVPSSYDFVHDPSMIKEGHTYYLFSTGAPDGAVGKGNIQIRTSTDLVDWRYRGTVFDVIPG
jgi:beta-xylosidase